MSQIWKCDFCDTEVPGLGPSRPRSWSRITVSKRGSTGTGHGLFSLEACEQCKDIPGLTVNKSDLVDMMKRLHILRSSPNIGSEAVKP